MKRILTLLVLGVVVSAHAQVSIKTRADSIAAIKNRQITTSVPPNLVYPVQVGSKTDSICALIKSLDDTVRAITSTTNGLGAVCAINDTTNTEIVVKSNSIKVINGQHTYYNGNGVTVYNTGTTINANFGTVFGVPGLSIRDNGSSFYSNLFAGSLTGAHSYWLPNEGGTAGITSTIVLHHTKDWITVDDGSGDSTRVDKGLVDVYAPPISTYNLVGELQPTGLLFGQRNASHTHQDGLTMTYTADGSNYAQTFQNASGVVALQGDFAQPSGQIAVGNGTGLTSDANLIYDGSQFKVAPGGTTLFQVRASKVIIGDRDAAINGTMLSVDIDHKASVFTNAIAAPTMQVETGGGDVTINNGVRGIYYDPATLVAAATITLPAAPVDGQEILIVFGGTITGSAAVVTAVTIAANSGQTINGHNTGSAYSGYTYFVKYRTYNSSWSIID
jgi:hypothetical protein